MSEVVPPVGKKEPGVQDEKRPSSRRVSRVIGLMLIGLAVLIAWVLLVGYLGWQKGQSDLVTRQAALMTEQIDNQLQLAQDDIAAGKVELAKRRLEWVLEHDAGNVRAQTMLDTLMAGGSETATAVPTAVTAAAPTNTPEPTPTPAPLGSPEAELQRIRRLVVAKEWEEVITDLMAFQRAYPAYERRETDELLFNAYVDYGIQLMNGRKVEQGLFYLKQAEAMGDLPQEALDYRTWAELYLQGISFYGVNWDVSAYYFRDLCLAAPFYQNSCDRLFEVLVAFGDQYAGAMEWCPAQQLYEEALRYGRTEALTEKANQAAETCALATPTPPSAPITDTVPLSNTVPSNSFLNDNPSFLTPTPTPEPVPIP